MAGKVKAAKKKAGARVTKKKVPVAERVDLWDNDAALDFARDVTDADLIADGVSSAAWVLSRGVSGIGASDPVQGGVAKCLTAFFADGPIKSADTAMELTCAILSSTPRMERLGAAVEMVAAAHGYPGRGLPAAAHWAAGSRDLARVVLEGIGCAVVLETYLGKVARFGNARMQSDWARKWQDLRERLESPGRPTSVQ